MSLNVDEVVVTDKKHMAELFNNHLLREFLSIMTNYVYISIRTD
jgi:hypothetical protein